jgi:4-aminobutyrate aminotransferase
LLLGIELVKNRETNERAPELRNQIVERAFRKGLLLLGCGDSAIRFTPPLVVTKSEIDVALEILDECLKEEVTS